MTGEMAWINQDGLDANGDVWSTHAAIAKAVGGTLQPFDAYQGPYIAVGADVTAGEPPYALAVRGLGVCRLWLCSDEDGIGYVYREDTDTRSEPFPLFHSFTDELASELAMPLLEPIEADCPA